MLYPRGRGARLVVVLALCACSCEAARKLGDAREKFAKAQDDIAEAQGKLAEAHEGAANAIAEANDLHREASKLVNRRPQRLTAGSDTQDCRADLLAGIEYLATEQGMPLKVEETQVDELVTAGATEIAYARDAVRYTLSFGVFKSEAGCDLDIYKRVQRKPGHESTDYNEYGLYSLSKCRCAE